MYRYLGTELNRTLCDVLQEMRTCYKTRNFSYMNSLLEEAQHMGNRMEAKLYDIKELKYLHESIKKAKKELEALNLQKDLIEGYMDGNTKDV